MSEGEPETQEDLISGLERSAMIGVDKSTENMTDAFLGHLRRLNTLKKRHSQELIPRGIKLLDHCTSARFFDLVDLGHKELAIQTIKSFEVSTEASKK